MQVDRLIIKGNRDQGRQLHTFIESLATRAAVSLLLVGTGESDSFSAHGTGVVLAVRRGTLRSGLDIIDVEIRIEEIDDSNSPLQFTWDAMQVEQPIVSWRGHTHPDHQPGEWVLHEILESDFSYAIDRSMIPAEA